MFNNGENMANLLVYRRKFGPHIRACFVGGTLGALTDLQLENRNPLLLAVTDALISGVAQNALRKYDFHSLRFNASGTFFGTFFVYKSASLIGNLTTCRMGTSEASATMVIEPHHFKNNPIGNA